MSVEWTGDVDYIDSLLNDVENRQRAKYYGPELTCRQLLIKPLSDSALFALIELSGEKAGFFCFLKGPHGWEMHATLEKTCRGRWGIKAGFLAVSLFFSRTSADELLATAPCHIPQALVYAKWIGFKKVGVNDLGDIQLKLCQQSLVSSERVSELGALMSKVTSPPMPTAAQPQPQISKSKPTPTI